VACGIAEIGMNGIVLTPQFGSRQRFHMIITDAELPESPLLDTPVCTKCGKCAASCPLGAIDMEHMEEITICGKTMQVAKINYDLCRTCKNGACVNRMYAPSKPDRIPALCNRTCLCELEEAGVLKNSFERPFRKRDAWSIGGKKTSLTDSSEKSNVLGGVFSTDGNRGAK
jgi:epoxyqueuosine reductase QueG